VGALEQLPQLAVYGVVSGSIITLGAVGLSLTYSILRFSNFSHGDLMTTGAYMGLGFLWLFQGLLPGRWAPLSFGPALLPALALAMVGNAGLAIVVDRLVFRRLRRAKPVLLLMAAVGVAFVLRNLVLFGAQSDPLYYSRRIQRALVLGGIRIKADQLFVIGVALLAVLALHLFLRYTKTGKAMRAMADNPDLAQVSGINTERVVIWTWALGAALAALAGILSGIENKLITPELGWQTLLPLFAAVILGGIGSPYGAMLGGMTIGLAEEVSTAFISTSYKPAVAFGVLVVMLLVRPQGLLGRR
jgi:branched-subunit amino acid ABC-type transport system permease component